MALTERQTDLVAILEAAPDAWVIVDKSGKIELVNRQAERVFGYGKEEMIGRPIEILVPERFSSVHPKHRHEYFQNPRVRPMGAGLRLFARRKGGGEFPCEISLSPLDIENGVYTMATVRDITERVEAEKRTRQLDEERRAREAAEEAVKARDQFLSIASHELRTPLTSLNLRLESLIRRSESGKLSPEDLAAQLAIPLKSGQRLVSLIDQLLDVARLSSQRLEILPEKTDLVKLVELALDQFDEEAQKAGSEVSAALPASLVGHWDPSRIEQVITNLVGNALKYGAGNPVDVVVTEASGQAVLSVVDRGIGVEPSHQSRIFDRFERAVSERTFGGLGLGLFISKEIVRLHGGEIDLVSAPGEGSTFTVTLPTDPTKNGQP